MRLHHARMHLWHWTQPIIECLPAPAQIQRTFQRGVAHQHPRRDTIPPKLASPTLPRVGARPIATIVAPAAPRIVFFVLPIFSSPHVFPLLSSRLPSLLLPGSSVFHVSPFGAIISPIFAMCCRVGFVRGGFLPPFAGILPGHECLLVEVTVFKILFCICDPRRACCLCRSCGS